MPGATTAADLAYAQDVLLNQNYDAEVQQLVELLGIFNPEVQAAGTAIYQSTITGTPEQYTEGEDIPLSKYTENAGEPLIVTIEPYRKRTTAQAIQKSGYYAAVSRTDDAMVKDLRINTVKSFFTALGNGTGTASGANFKKALINAGTKLSNEMERKGDTVNTPVYFVNRDDYAAWVGDNDVSNDGTGNVFGMTYILNLAGINGITFLTSNVKAGEIYATDSENIHMYVPDYAAAEEGGLDYEISDLGVIATHHEPSYAGASVETYVNTGLLIVPEFVNYIVKSTVTVGE